jgi:hypothetical protein
MGAYYRSNCAGMICFGGVLTVDNPAVVNSSYGVNDNYSINFDTLHGALVCCLYLLVLNDWPALMDGTVAAVGKAARVYFFAFWLVNIVLVLNVLVAFVIDSFSTQKVKRETFQWIQDTGMHAHFGIEDWRKLMTESAQDFSAFRISKNSHHFDVYDELYKTEVRGETQLAC